MAIWRSDSPWATRCKTVGHCAGGILKRGMGGLTCCFRGRGSVTPLMCSRLRSIGKVGDRGPDARRFRPSGERANETLSAFLRLDRLIVRLLLALPTLLSYARLTPIRTGFRPALLLRRSLAPLHEPPNAFMGGSKEPGDLAQRCSLPHHVSRFSRLAWCQTRGLRWRQMGVLALPPWRQVLGAQPQPLITLFPASALFQPQRKRRKRTFPREQSHNAPALQVIDEATHGQ